MANSKSGSKNHTRDLMEYLLLISFVFLGSSYVVASELRVASGAQKTQDGLQIRDVAERVHRHTIFGQSTKRHIK